MLVQPNDRPNRQLAQKWSELAGRRRAHFIELYESGRWKHYYTETEFLTRMRDVIHAADEWERLASARPDARDAG